MRNLVSHIIVSALLVILVVTVFIQQISIRGIIRLIFSPFKIASLLFGLIIREVLGYRHALDLRSQKVYDYCKLNGYQCKDFIICTEDGYQLLIHRISNGRPSLFKYPVLVMHGLLQSSGVFVTSGKNSFAFWLVEQGFDVWLGENRGTHLDPQYNCHQPTYIHPPRGVKVKTRHDSDYWQWTLDDFAMFDLPALVNFVLKETGSEKIHYIGHSQGNAQGFIAMSVDKDLKSKVASFTCLAPAAFVGPLIKKFPVNSLINMGSSPKTDKFDLFFGTQLFAPHLSVSQKYINSHVFALMGYNVFSQLFDWKDNLWIDHDVTQPGSSGLKEIYKIGYFCFTPRDVSSKLIQHWSQCAAYGRLLQYSSNVEVFKNVQLSESKHKVFTRRRMSFIEYDSMSNASSQQSLEDLTVATDVDSTLRKSYKSRSYDVARLHDLPMLIFYGQKDYLVDAAPLLQHLYDGARRSARRKNQLAGTVQPNILITKCVDDYEHMDFMWAHNAEKEVWQPMLEQLKKLDSQLT